MYQPIASESWSRLASTRDVGTLLYEGQLSAVLTVDAIPVRLVWTQDMWEHLLRCLETGDSIEPPDYPGSQNDLTMAVRRWQTGGGTTLVVGSVSPWVEAILHQEGCSRIVTLDIAKIDSEVNALATVTYAEWAECCEDVDMIVSFSTVEHFGLGRYGDQQDGEADIKWMRDFALRNLHADGVHLIAVPVASVDSWSDAHRIYGPNRMRRLTEGWQLAEVIYEGQILDHIPFKETHSGEDWQKQPVLVLRRDQK